LAGNITRKRCMQENTDFRFNSQPKASCPETFYGFPLSRQSITKQTTATSFHIIPNSSITISLPINTIIHIFTCYITIQNTLILSTLDRFPNRSTKNGIICLHLTLTVPKIDTLKSEKITHISKKYQSNMVLREN
jgi:hypothetical protein